MFLKKNDNHLTPVVSLVYNPRGFLEITLPNIFGSSSNASFLDHFRV